MQMQSWLIAGALMGGLTPGWAAANTCDGAIPIYNALNTACPPGSDGNFNSTSCGTPACTAAAKELFSKAADVATGLAACNGQNAGYALFAQQGSAGISVFAVTRLLECGLEVPSEMKGSVDTCEGATILLFTWNFVCKCTDTCTGGTGSCTVGRDEPGRCSGECKDTCTPATCGTPACKTASDDILSKTKKLSEALSTCGASSPTRGIAMGSVAYAMQIDNRMMECGLLTDNCEPGDCGSTCTSAISACANLTTAVDGGCLSGCPKCLKDKYNRLGGCEDGQQAFTDGANGNEVCALTLLFALLLGNFARV